MSATCYKCSQKLEQVPMHGVSRSEECPSCYTSIRCCRMCSFYDIFSYNDCKEPTADRIVEKEKANFCDHFILSSSNQSTESKKEELLSAADSLFKK